MKRCATPILGAFALAAALLAVDAARAQENAPAPAPAGAEDKNWPQIGNVPTSTQFGKDPQYGRGPGFYFSAVKLGLVVALFLLWVKTTDWISQDCLRLNMNYVVWNGVVFGVFLAAFVLFWLIPWFEVGFLIMVAAYLGPVLTYVVVRNKRVQAHQRVLTPDHLRHVFSDVMKLVGIKVATEKKAEHEKGPPVQFKGTAGCGRDGEANLLLARRSPGYVPTKELIADLLDRTGDSVMLEATAANVAVRFQIDGAWHNFEPKEREPGGLILAVLKTMGGVDANERGKKQEGIFAADYKGTHYFSKLHSQPAEGGERTIVSLHPTKTTIRTFEELGMRAKTQEQLKELLNRSKGFILFASMPGGGLSNLFDAALKTCDRYMRDFASVEDVNHREHEIENLHVTTYNPAKGETPIPVLQKVIRTYPNALVMRHLPDAETVKLLCEQIAEDRLVLAAIRAKDSPEALLRVLMLKVPPKDFVTAITGVVAVRLLRKLCDECKEGYPAPADALQQFGIPPGKVQTLYRPPSEPDPKKPCPHCAGIGYKGRTGLFELLIVDDGVREVLLKSPKLDLVRAASRRAGMKTFQEEGLLLVVKGVTSLAELQRVMKQ